MLGAAQRADIRHGLNPEFIGLSEMSQRWLRVVRL
jgi:hypothetical protein